MAHTESRPWGYCEVLDEGEGWLLKKLVIHPGQSISLQYHLHRQEHWMFVQGSGYLISGDARGNFGIGAIHTVEKEMTHRIVNNGEIDVVVIELQTGSILSEDDIVRLEDQYGRTTP